ncbi:MAG: AbrB/MazE/SpoVT family DNA-binding domain-containing protein [Chloroflexota bacterium]|nr:AbrB/MazE/SpoVT family DNA-binding domain-containing protein [Chloroflexota bacterium]
MRTTVSVRGQTVIPRPIREALGITPATQLEWRVKDGVILAFPIPSDPVRAAVGVLKGRGPTTEELLAERKMQREKEQ